MGAVIRKLKHPRIKAAAIFLARKLPIMTIKSFNEIEFENMMVMLSDSLKQSAYYSTFSCSRSSWCAIMLRSVTLETKRRLVRQLEVGIRWEAVVGSFKLSREPWIRQVEVSSNLSMLVDAVMFLEGVLVPNVIEYDRNEWRKRMIAVGKNTVVWSLYQLCSVAVLKNLIITPEEHFESLADENVQYLLAILLRSDRAKECNKLLVSSLTEFHLPNGGLEDSSVINLHK